MAKFNLAAQPGRSAFLTELLQDPQYQMAMRAYQQGSQTTPVQSGGEGLARALQGVAGGYFAGQAQGRMKDREKAYSQTLADALAAGQPWRNPDTDPEAVAGAVLAAPNDGRRYLAPGEVAAGTGGLPAMARVLAGNPDTATLGLQMQFEDMQQKAKFAAEAAKDERLNRRTEVLEEGRDRRQAQAFAGQFILLDQRLANDQTLVEIYDPNSPTGTRMVKRPEAIGKAGKPPSGVMEIIGYDDKGRPLIRMGGSPKVGAAEGDLAKTTINKIEESLLNAGARLERIGAIERGFKPEYQKLPTKLGMVARRWADFAGLKLAPEQSKALREYTQFRSDAYSDLSKTLQEMSGAAVTPQEEERLLRSIPDPGNDSPTEFEAKLDATIRAMRLVEARLHFLRKNGFRKVEDSKISLNAMQDIINKRGQEIEAAVRQQAPQANDADVTREVMRALTTEFGVRMQ